MKLLIVSITLMLSALVSNAQVIVDDYDFKKSVDEHTFTSVPFYARWDMQYDGQTDYKSVFGLDIYYDFQRKHKVSLEHCSNTSIGTKFKVPGNLNLLIGVLDCDGEYGSTQLFILGKNDYSIKDSMYVSHDCSSGASMQYTVQEIRDRMPKLIVTVYTFIPESSRSVDIEEFRFTPNAKITGKIRKDEYEVANCFIHRSSNVSPNITVKSSHFAVNYQLWMLYDEAVGGTGDDGSNPNPPIDDKPGPIPPYEIRGTVDTK